MTHNVLNRGDHSITGKTVCLSDLASIADAYPTSRCLSGTDDYWAMAEYIDRMEDPATKERYDVVYLFTQSDMDTEESDFPFDEDHIARVFAVYEDER